MKKNQVIDFMNALEKDDKGLNLCVKTYEALSAFLTDFDFLKDSLGFTQQDVADKMGTTQSAISRIASLKTNPSYKQLLKDVGGRRWRTVHNSDEEHDRSSSLRLARNSTKVGDRGWFKS